MRAVANADLIVTTPEKWDGVSRSWQTRSYVKAVALLVIDEIHLLGTLNYIIMSLYIFTCTMNSILLPPKIFHHTVTILFTGYTELNCYIPLDMYLYQFTVKESN